MRPQLTRGRTELLHSAAAALAALLLFSCFCGCFALSPAVDNTEEDAGGGGFNTAAPETPAPTEYFAQNPVYTLFEEYFAARSAAADGLLLSAAESEDPLAALYYADCCSCEAELTLVYATVGMLTADGSGFSGSFTGTYAGSGAMSSRGVFEYDFESGVSLFGSLADGLLQASSGTPSLPDTFEEPSPVPTQELTPGPSAEATEHESLNTSPPDGDNEPAVTPEQGSTPAPESTPEPVLTPEPTPEPTPAPYLKIGVFTALKRTESGWISTVKRDGVVYVTELNNGALYFVRAEESALPAGFEPLNGIAGLSPAELGLTIMKYGEGTLVLHKP